MLQTYKQCKHLMTEGKDAHTCPTAEERQATAALISDAAQASEQFDQDELESFAYVWRKYHQVQDGQ